MKFFVLAVTVCCVLSFLAPTKSYANEQDWSFVQAVGGMRLGQPKRTSVEWTLPIDIDITGLHAITTQPTTVHSGIICEGIGAQIHDKNIYLALFTGMPWIGAANGKCPPVSLGDIPPGEYTVYYSGLNEDPIKLSEIWIAP